MKKILAFIFALTLSLTMILSTRTYAETPQVMETFSGVKYGPFTTVDENSIQPTIEDNLYLSKDIEVANNYDELKDAIYKGMKNYEQSYTINYKGNTSTIVVDIESMWEEIFDKDDYLYGTVNTYSFAAKGFENDVTVLFTNTYHTTKAQEEFVDEEVIRVINEIIKPGMSDFQKIKVVNDWIVNNTKWTFNTSTSPRAAYTLFKDGKGVCQAYALAAFKLLEKANIEVRYVTGYVLEGESYDRHGWNLVKANGKWYHLDTTWNDPYSSTGDILSYECFLISDDTMKADHFMDDFRTFPKATDKYYEVMRNIYNPVELGNSMYYINHINNSDYKLYKLNLDNMLKTKLTDDNVQFIAGYGDWIYYSNYSYGGYLYKIKTNGRENTQLNSVDSMDIYIEGSYLYFRDNTNSRQDKIKIEEQTDVTKFELTQMIQIIEGLKQDDYTAKSWGFLAKALNNARVVRDNNLASDIDIIVALDTLTRTWYELIDVKDIDVDKWKKDLYKGKSEVINVKFSLPIDSKLAENYIFISRNRDGSDKVSGTYLESDLKNKTISLHAPKGGYDSGTYYLFIEKGLYSVNSPGDLLKRTIRMKVIIQ